MLELAIDIETYSSNDIKCGVNKYVESTDFEILIIAYKFSDEKHVTVLDSTVDDFRCEPFFSALQNPDIIKTAYNAVFEITCLSKFFNVTLPLDQWSCTMNLAAKAGLPFGLDAVTAAIGDGIEQKDRRGKDLIRLFSIPAKKQLENDEVHTYRVSGIEAPEKWEAFKNYCKQDVIAEQAVRDAVKWFKDCDFEKDMWVLHENINNNGVLADISLVNNAIKINDAIEIKLKKYLTDLTGISNPKSTSQIKKYLHEKSGVKIESLAKNKMQEVSEKLKGQGVDEILKIRNQLNYSSVAKYTAMSNSVCFDGRIRGLFQYYGASRTGRSAGRNVQLQNLKRNDLPDLNIARELVREGNLELLELLYDDVGSVLSNLVRTAFVPEPGKVLYVSDLNAIEARVLAWYANETWRLNVFGKDGKIYEASAAAMFKIPIELVTKDSDYRAKGKVAELALGYQGGIGALTMMGAKEMGMDEADMQTLVVSWRQANKNIVKFWYDIQAAVVAALEENAKVRLRGLLIYKLRGRLIIKLPSGRSLVYYGAKIVNDEIYYNGTGHTSNKWEQRSAYGGQFVANIVQATARDILFLKMKQLDARGFKIIMHVHDEVVCEMPLDESLKNKMNAVMNQSVEWAIGLPLAAETFTCEYYRK